MLTALHALSGNLQEKHKLHILTYNQPNWNVLFYDEIGSPIDYYSQFPEATLEYYDEAYDLAVLSFKSENAYVALPISQKSPDYKEQIGTMSNPYNQSRNFITTGYIISKKPISFGDDLTTGEYEVIKHSAKIAMGSSGSVLLNRDLEIIGINLGGGETIFGQFQHGLAMPSDKILDFLEGIENFQFSFLKNNVK